MENLPKDVQELIKQLRTTRSAHERLQVDYTGALDVLYSTIATLWADVLGVPGVRQTDNIFDLGGDSIHIVQIAARIREIYNVEITFGEFFDAPTVRELGDLVSQKSTTKTEGS